MTLQSSPLPDTERRRGTALGRARLTALAVGAVVIIAIVIATQLGRNEPATPRTPSGDHDGGTSLRTGPAPRVPYLIGQGLYIDGTSLPGEWFGLTTAGRSSVGIRSLPDEDGASVVLRDGRVVLTAASVPWSEAVLSPDGDLVAYAETDPDRTSGHLVLRDLRTGHDLARIPVNPTVLTVDDERQEHLIRVDNDGTVTYGGLRGWHTWRPGSPPVDSPAPADGRLFPGFPRYANPVWLSPDESRGAWLTRGDGSLPPPDVDLRGVLDGLAVQQPGDAGTRVTIPLPPGTDAHWLTWETSTDLLVTVDDPRLNSAASYLRCSVTAHACERAPTPFDP